MKLKKIKKLVKKKEEFQKLLDMLIIGIAEGKYFGDRYFTAQDGFIVGLLYCNAGYIRILVTTDEFLPPASDNNIQQLQQILVWMIRNEDNLVTLFKAKDYEQK